MFFANQIADTYLSYICIRKLARFQTTVCINSFLELKSTPFFGLNV